MKCKESQVRMSPLFVIIAAIAFLLAVTVVATETTGLESQRLQIDQLDVPADRFLVRRSTGGDVLDRSSLHPVPVEGRHMELEDAYYLYHMDGNDPARLDGILMDDPRLFALICRTA